MSTQVEVHGRGEIQRFSQQLSKMDGQFRVALPSHIGPERFQRVVMTAVNRNSELLIADRKSLLESCMLCAQDGLLPDGRQAALVIFNTNIAKKGEPPNWIKKVQYMPMVAGIRMKIYQSGEIKGLTARIAYENDEFDVVLGDNERIDHKPNLFDRGRMIAGYAVATFRDGSKEFEVMTIADIEKVRAVSRNKDAGPWRDWYEEMAKKTVIRRLSKSLPVSAELSDFLRRDDSFYDLNQSQQIQHVRAAPQTIEARLDHFANENESSAPAAGGSNADAESPEAVPHDASGKESASPLSPADDGADSASEQMDSHTKEAYEKGRAAARSGYAREVPKALKAAASKAAFLRGHDDEAAEAEAADGGTV